MIQYKVDRWAILYLFRVRGSVFPKALVWSIPAAIITGLVHMYEQEKRVLNLGTVGLKEAWAGYTFVLMFLLVFRSNISYNRFWEGSKKIFMVRGSWFAAATSLITFSSTDPSKRSEVAHFQLYMVRLFSILFCSALQRVADLDDAQEEDVLEILDATGISPESLDFLRNVNDRAEVVVQWIQRLIMQKMEQGVLVAPPPILSHSIHLMQQGMNHFDEVIVIKDIDFPFPYSQMTTVMVFAQWAMTILLAAREVESATMAAIAAFSVTFGIFSLLYIPFEIDQPFGKDANDLPLQRMQEDFNKSLLDLLHPLVQEPPEFNYSSSLAPPMVVDSDTVPGLTDGEVVRGDPSESEFDDHHAHREDKLRRLWGASVIQRSNLNATLKTGQRKKKSKPTRQSDQSRMKPPSDPEAPEATDAEAAPAPVPSPPPPGPTPTPKTPPPVSPMGGGGGGGGGSDSGGGGDAGARRAAGSIDGNNAGNNVPQRSNRAANLAVPVVGQMRV